MDDFCPFCRAIRTIEPKTHYDCGQPRNPSKMIRYRPGLCYETQLTSLRTALEDMTIQRDAARRDVAVLKTELHRISGKP
jgi:hypothetical protein